MIPKDVSVADMHENIVGDQMKWKGRTKMAKPYTVREGEKKREYLIGT